MSSVKQTIKDIANAIRAIRYGGADGSMSLLEMPDILGRMQPDKTKMGYQIGSFISLTEGDGLTYVMRTLEAYCPNEYVGSVRIQEVLPHALEGRFFQKTLQGNIYLDDIQTVDDYGMAHTFEWYSHETVSYEEDQVDVSFGNLRTIGEDGMNSIFKKNNFVKKVSMPYLQTVEAYGLEEAFKDCENLKVVDWSNLEAGGSFDYSAFFGMFYGCSGLEYILFSNVVRIPDNLEPDSQRWFDQNTTYKFKIVVPDSLYNDWVADSRWSNYASQIITVTEYENETEE